MATTRERLKQIETEFQFERWVCIQRMFETMSTEELETLAGTGLWPNRPAPPPGACRLDAMDRGSVRKRWRDDRKYFAGRNSSELEFYAIHGHWPEQGCSAECSAPASKHSISEPHGLRRRSIPRRSCRLPRSIRRLGTRGHWERSPHLVRPNSNRGYQIRAPRATCTSERHTRIGVLCDSWTLARARMQYRVQELSFQRDFLRECLSHVVRALP